MTTKLRPLLLLPALILGACGTTQTTTNPTPVTQAPTAPKNLGLYELHISGSAGKTATATVTRLGGGKLSAQEISGLTFTAATASVSTAGTDKHLAVSVTVNNNSGADITKPTFIPVSITGYTQGSTYFRNAQDSSGAATDPTGIVIEQAVSGTTTVLRDANATPLIGTLDTSALSFDVPAGTSVGSVSPNGWQSPTLANGSAQTVTFGVNAGTNLTYRMSLVFGVFDSPNITTTSATGTAIFSEYMEGSGNNKAIEIYNASQTAIPSGTLAVKLFSNGSATANTTFAIQSTIIPGQTYVISQSSAAAELRARANVISGVVNYNGDDALTLEASATVTDSFGQVGFDPGTAWTVGGVTTADKTLRRKVGVITGDTSSGDTFDPSLQWDQFNVDAFDGLGYR